MKICMVLEFFIPHYNGGGEHRCYELAKRLVCLGHNVDVLTMKFVDVPDYENIDGINVHHIGPVIKKPPFRSVSNFLSYLISVIRWIQKHDYDIVDTQAYSPLLSTFIITRLKGIPLVGTIHDTSSNNNDQWIQFSNLASIMEKFLIRLPYDKIITVSHATKNSLINDFGVKDNKIEILYNGVDIKKFDSINATKVQDNQIIFVGRLAPHKHVDDLINVINNIKNNYTSIKLVVVGKGEEKNKLTKLVETLNLSEFVDFKENLTDEELICEMKKSTLLVLPSTREGFGMVLAEANCCKKPVVTYVSGGTVEVVENGYNGFLVDEENVEELTKRIAQILEDKKLQKMLGENGRKKVEKEFDWENIVKEYLNIISRIVD